MLERTPRETGRATCQPSLAHEFDDPGGGDPLDLAGVDIQDPGEVPRGGAAQIADPADEPGTAGHGHHRQVARARLAEALGVGPSQRSHRWIDLTGCHDFDAGTRVL